MSQISCYKYSLLLSGTATEDEVGERGRARSDLTPFSSSSRSASVESESERSTTARRWKLGLEAKASEGEQRKRKDGRGRPTALENWIRGGRGGGEHRVRSEETRGAATWRHMQQRRRGAVPLPRSSWFQSGEIARWRRIIALI